MQKNRDYFFKIIFMIFSQLTLVVPLVSAQLSFQYGAFGSRRAALSFFAALGLLFLMSVLFFSPLIFSAFLWNLVWFPLVFCAIWLRQRAAHSLAVLIMLNLPSLILAVVCAFGPHLFELNAFFDAWNARAESEILKLKELGAGAAAMTSELTKARASLELFRSSADFKEMLEFWNMTPASRIHWLIFGAGSSILFGVVASASLSWLAIYHTFWRLQKLSFVTKYFEENSMKSSSESKMMEAVRANLKFLALPGTKQGYVSKDFESVRIVSHGKLAPAQSDFSTIPTPFLLKPDFMGFDLFGLKFRLGQDLENVENHFFQNPSLWSGSWQLTKMRVALWLPAAAVCLLGLCWWVGGSSNPLAIPQDGGARDFFAWLGFLVYLALSWVSLWAVLLAFLRIKPLFLLVLALICLSFGGFILNQPFMVLFFLTSIVLLDLLYDFRGLLELSGKRV